MAIEKMVLVQIVGTLKKVNKTLFKCCESKCFHIIQSHQGTALEGSTSGSTMKTLKGRNPYAPLLKRAEKLKEYFGAVKNNVNYDDVEYNVSIDFDRYLDNLEAQLNELVAEKTRLTEEKEKLDVAMMNVEHLKGMESSFEELYACEYIKIRFGYIPVESYPKLEYYKHENFFFYPFQNDGKNIWGMYIVLRNESTELDRVLSSLYFHRVRMPDFLKGNADDAHSAILRNTTELTQSLDELNVRINEVCEKERAKFEKVYAKLSALDGSYLLRTNVSVFNNKFFMSGFIPQSESERFTKLVETEGVEAKIKPNDSNMTINSPVKLKNNRLFRPFEMFVKMYGLPDSNGIDPTPFVAITYMLIYGIMFGDLGQGLVIMLLGILLDRFKHVKLAPIMTRIGFSSAIFGTLYGSVFGNEELITPFFKLPNIYEALGYSAPPENIFQISSMLLIAALAIGIILLILTITMNLILSLRKKDYVSALISPNGLCGLVFYIAIVAGAIGQLVVGTEMFTTPYVLCLIVLPLVLLFFKEPISSLINAGRYSGLNTQYSYVVHSLKSYSTAISRGVMVTSGGCSLDALASSKSLKFRYGKMTVEHYNALWESLDLPYVFFPLENEDDCISGIYIASKDHIKAVDAIFDKLSFAKEKMPDYVNEILRGKPADISVSEMPKPKKSVGNFIIEGVIELFESCLTYLTNTMSFLRIGGFILSHAGLMLVVNVLASQQTGVGSIVVQVLGNAFVIGMEGFLVGIQVLRLEFYEMFSRFYTANGKPFNPVVLDKTSAER